MLKLIGLYIPFVVVFLGIGACSFVYKDDLLGRFSQEEETVSAPEISEEPLPSDATDVGEPTAADDSTGEETPEEVSDEQPELPAIGECFCPKRDPA